MGSARVAARQQNSWERNRIPGTPFRRHCGPLKSQPRTGHTREPCICTFPHVPLALHSPPLGYCQCFNGRLEGWSAAPAVNTQDLSGRVEHHTLVLADHFRVRGSHMRAVPSRCPMLLSLGTLADPAPSFPEANSTHATHAFLSLQFIAAPTMTPTMMAWHVHQEPDRTSSQPRSL